MTLAIACYGDSTVYGWTANGDASGPTPERNGTVFTRVPMPAPDALQTLLRLEFPDITVENHGAVGTTAQNWLDGTGGVLQPWAAELAANPAPWVLICLGINDEPADLGADYEAMVALAENAGKRVIIQTPNALDIAWGDITPKVETIRAVHAAHPNSILVDFYAHTQTMGVAWHEFLSYSPMTFPLNPTAFWSGIHPTQAGYDVMANVMMSSLRSSICQEEEQGK